jgi:sarcosine oxidase
MANDVTADVIIVGGGVMGCAAAYQLARDGQRVLLIEQFGIVHTNGSSHGPSRIIRLAYDTADYVELARAAYQLWHAAEAESDRQLLRTIGGLDIGVPGALALDDIRATYQATGVPFETLDHAEIVRRFPKFNLPAATIGYYQPDYGLLAADQCVATLADLARRHGAQIHEYETALAVTPLQGGVLVRTDRGSYSADRLIVSAGSWIGPLLAPLGINLPLTITKELIGYFQPPDPEAYMPERFPLFIHRFPNTTTLGSGFPIFGHAGFKMIYDRTGPVVTPDDPDREPAPGQLDLLLDYAASILPALGRQVIETVTCRYTMVPDEHFIIDRHPEYPQIVIASPCSGHGFKFGSVIGRILADLAIHGRTTYPISRFRLDRMFEPTHGGVDHGDSVSTP